MNINTGRLFKSSFCPGLIVGIIAMLLVRNVFRHIIDFSNVLIFFFCEGAFFTLLYIIMIYAFVLNAKDKRFFFQLVKKHSEKN